MFMSREIEGEVCVEPSSPRGKGLVGVCHSWSFYYGTGRSDMRVVHRDVS